MNVQTAPDMDGLRNSNSPKTSGLMAAFVILWILFLGGCSIASFRPGITPSPEPILKPSTPTNLAGISHPRQKLRLINQSNIFIQNLTVRFPVDQIFFGNVPAGVTTEYREVPDGVYRYAAYSVEVYGKKYEQPVVDWIGETPMPGNAFTYIVTIDPGGWETRGQVVQLVEVKKDD